MRMVTKTVPDRSRHAPRGAVYGIKYKRCFGFWVAKYRCVCGKINVDALSPTAFLYFSECYDCREKELTRDAS